VGFLGEKPRLKHFTGYTYRETAVTTLGGDYPPQGHHRHESGEEKDQ
jgi:hypothetical protein